MGGRVQVDRVRRRGRLVSVLTLLSVAGGILGKVLGTHLVGPNSAVSKVEAAVTGLGVRFIGGIGIGAVAWISGLQGGGCRVRQGNPRHCGSGLIGT